MKSISLPKLAALSLTLALALLLLSAPPEAAAFCGFYVGKADAGLYNRASQVVVVRHDNKTVISMMNDYKGELSEFALVVPVPVVLEKGQIHIGDRELFKRIDAYSAPRLVEYHDPDPCQIYAFGLMASPSGASAVPMEMARNEMRSLGVTIEAQYTVGEYDIVILSARESGGLETWLIENGYHIPYGARAALQPYVKQDMKFFVAKVNVKEQAHTGLNYLRPLQFAFDSPKFMLPIRLGMLNAQGPQDLIIYMLTQEGRVEVTNYRTEKLPSGTELPQYVKDEFPRFYKAMFEQQVKDSQMKTVFTEYFWNMGWCDPCAADPLSPDELRKLGVFWLDDQPQPGRYGGAVMPMPSGGALPVMVTRLHVRYSAATFPEDLVFQETQDHENYQARYVLHYPWRGSPDSCAAAKVYFEQAKLRTEKEAENLAALTGWDIKEVFKKANLNFESPPKAWWQHLWGPSTD